MLTVRQNKIVEILSEANEVISAGKLSVMLDVSSKTIRNDIHQINTIVEEPLIDVKAGQGFYLDRERFSQLGKITAEEELNSSFEILKKIIDQEKIDYFSLAESFFMSESTLDRTIKELNKVIVKRDPSLCIYRKQNQLMIDGDEEQKRKIFNLFLNQEIENNKLSLEKYANYFDYCDLKELSQLILAYHQSRELVMNDFFIISFILHVAVLLERINKGSYLQIENEIQNSPEVESLAKELAKLLEEKYNIAIPQQELGYLERLYTGRVVTKDRSQIAIIQKVVIELLMNIQATYGVDFSLDQQLEGYLTNHLSALYLRATKEQYLMNPLTEELKNQFPFIYNISVYASAIIQEKLAIHFPDEEIAYITLHFLSATETINFRHKRRVLLLFPYGVAGQRLARKKLEKITSSVVEVICATAFQSGNELPIDQIDLVVSSEVLPNNLGVETYKFHSMLTDEDIQQIEKLLIKKQEEASILQQFFKKELYFPHQNFETREAVIQFLCEKLTEQNYCDVNYVQKVLERDELSSTSFGNYYALPHAIKRSANKNGIAVCCLDKPIDWSGKKVRLVLLIAMKEERDNSFEQLFVQLVTILNDPSFVKKLAKQDSFEAFLQLCEGQ